MSEQPDFLTQLAEEEFGGKEQRLRDAYRHVFDSEQGKIVFADLARRNFLLSPTFTPDPNQTAFNEGCRCVILHIQTMMEFDHMRLRLLMRKANEDE